MSNAAHKAASLLEKAMQAHQSGKWHMAESNYLKVIEIDPHNPDALHQLGMLYHVRGEFQKALKYFSASIQLAPGFGPLYSNLGMIHDSLGQPAEAIAAYRACIELAPNFANAYLNLANLLLKQLKYNDAERYYRDSLQLDPASGPAWSGLGLTLMYLGDHANSLKAHEKAVNIAPGLAQAHLNYAHALMHQGRAADAQQHYLRAITLDPHLGHARAYLGNLRREIARSAQPEMLSADHAAAEAWAYVAHASSHLRKIEQAEEAYGKANALNPQNGEYLIDMAGALEVQGKIAEAAACYDEALQTPLANVARVKHALMTSPLYSSAEQMEKDRARIAAEIEALLQEDTLHFADPMREWGKSNFYLAYHNQNDIDIQRKIAELNLKIYPTLNWTAPYIADWKNKLSPKRIRLGIISGNLHNHTISKLNLGWIERMDRSHFELVLLKFSSLHDSVAATVDTVFDSSVSIPSNTIDEARAAVAAAQLDILFYPDIGMDVFTYFLAFARLAPVQCVSWGHPVTTGIPAVDYFISSKHIETQDAQTHYSETLVKFDRLPCYYLHPGDIAAKTRNDFDLPEDAHIYLVPQTLFKFHPDIDSIFAEFLTRDPSALIVLIAGVYPNWNRILRERFEKAFQADAERVHFLSAMSQSDFLALLKLADALLDTPYFGGGNTTYEAMSLGCPIVTWPGKHMRGRVTDGCYRQMGITDLSATSREEYIALALKLATDKTFHAQMRAQIEEARELLFETTETVLEFEEFFAKALASEKA